MTGSAKVLRMRIYCSLCYPSILRTLPIIIGVGVGLRVHVTVWLSPERHLEPLEPPVAPAEYCAHGRAHYGVNRD